MMDISNMQSPTMEGLKGLFKHKTERTLKEAEAIKKNAASSEQPPVDLKAMAYGLEQLVGGAGSGV